MPAIIRQNFHDESEAALNKQINMELRASYFYQAIAYQFDRHDVALKNFFKFFKECSNEEREHAEKLMRYVNSRGGRIQLTNIEAPPSFIICGGLEAMRRALDLEREVNDSLLKLHQLASRHNDAHLTDYLEEHFLDEQVRSIEQLGHHITNLERVGTGLGEFQFDKLTLSD